MIQCQLKWVLPRKKMSRCVGENEREKSDVLDKMVREEGFFEVMTFEQKPEVRDELLRCPWEQRDLHLERSQGQVGAHNFRQAE